MLARRGTLLSMLTISLIMLAGVSFAAIWEDNFDDGNADGWDEVAGSWEVKDGTYQQTDLLAEYQKSVAVDTKDWTDYTLEVDVTIVEGGAGSASVAAGVLLRANKDGSSGYRFWIRDDSSGFQFSTWQDEAYTHVVTDAAERAVAGQAYRLKVQVEGFKFSAWVDDRLMVEDHDEAGELFPSGQIAFINYNCHAIYDNLTISGPGIPSNIAVAPAGKLAATWGTIKMSKAK